MKIDSVETLLKEELRDIYDAEKQLTRALPKMAKAADSDELKSALKEHLEVTKGQVERLNQVFSMLDQPPRGRTSVGMRGLIEEGQDVMDRKAEAELADAGLIVAAQKVEHYEIAAYGSVRRLAEMIGKEDIAALLGQTLAEEEVADRRLSEICEQLLEQDAATENVTTVDEEESVEMTGEEELEPVSPARRSTE